MTAENNISGGADWPALIFLLNLVQNRHIIKISILPVQKGVSMKFIHLSDLHLGKRVNEYSMLEDQKYILKQILGIMDAERIIILSVSKPA